MERAFGMHLQRQSGFFVNQLCLQTIRLGGGCIGNYYFK